MRKRYFKEIINDELFKSVQHKRLLFACWLFLLFILEYWNVFIREIILEWFTLKENSSSITLDLVFSIVFGYSIFTQIKWLLNKYRPSAVQYLFFVLIWTVYLKFRFSLDGVRFDSPYLFGKFDCLGYLDYLLISTFPLIILVLKRFKNIIEREKIPTISFFNEDLPIESENEDNIGFKIIIENLHQKIVTDYYHRSFTIGIFGAWGHGKTSFMNLLEKKIYDSDKLGAIQIKFLPFLNHNSKDITLEYFNTLKKGLSVYDGRLAGKIEDYAQKLTQVYKDFSIIQFFENKIKEDSLVSMYEEINDIIFDINRPIIVYIDDLDRLQSEEIITVLRIIRNSANFANTVFVLGVDIEYVRGELSRLKIPNIDDYLKKFFQLEITVPLISSQILKDRFIHICSEKAIVSDTLSWQYDLIEMLKSELCLFDSYIKNYRDLKRYLNQFLFEKEILKNEVNDLDLLNFIFLRSKYPWAINWIETNQKLYFELSGDLILLSETGEQKSIFQKNTLDVIFDETIVLNSSLSKSKLYIDYESGFSSRNDEKVDELLIKTLFSLFSKSKNNASNSINRTHLFKRVIGLSHFENYFTESEFQSLMKINNFVDLKNRLDELSHTEMLEQFYDRLKYVPFYDLNTFKFIFYSYIICFAKIENFKLNYNNFYSPLNSLIESVYGVLEEAPLLNEFIYETIISEEVALDLKWKIEVFRVLHNCDRRDSQSKWEDATFATKLFKLMLSEINKTDFDYTLFNYYHDLKDISLDNGVILKKELNTLLKSFLNNEMNLLRFFNLIIDNVEYNNMFMLSNVLDEIYDSKQDFVEQVLTIQKNQNPKVKEMIEFLKLSSVVNFKFSIHFHFHFFEIENRNEKSGISKRQLKYLEEKSKRIFQIFIKTNEEVPGLMIKLRNSKQLKNDTHIDFFHVADFSTVVIRGFSDDKKGWPDRFVTELNNLSNRNPHIKNYKDFLKALGYEIIHDTLQKNR